MIDMVKPRTPKPANQDLLTMNPQAGFDPKPGDSSWNFWTSEKAKATTAPVVRSAKRWFDAREQAAIQLNTSPQDLYSEPVEPVKQVKP